MRAQRLCDQEPDLLGDKRAASCEGRNLGLWEQVRREKVSCESSQEMMVVRLKLHVWGGALQKLQGTLS